MAWGSSCSPPSQITSRVTCWAGSGHRVHQVPRLALLAFYTSDRDAHLGPDAPTAEATIVDIVHPLGERRDDVVVEFTTSDGRRVRAQTEEFMFSPHPVIGSTAVVRYDPQDPQEYVRDDRLGSDGFLTAMGAAFSLVFAVGGVQGFRRRLPAWVVSGGR